MTDRAVTYSEYLAVDELLALQRPRSAGPEHDELLFIVVHQVYELWFKQVLWELDHAIELLEADETHRVGHTLHRVLRILKVMVAQMDVLETMTPLEFDSFRDRLDSASGFQSAQFRELEIVLGRIRGADVLARFESGSAAHGRLVSRLGRPTLWDAFVRHLGARSRPDGPPIDVVDRTALQDALLDAYRHDPPMAALCERLVDLDEGLQEWRYRHVKMVERTIGTKPGTGGSAGAEYLKSTLDRPVFPDLWTIRTRF